MIKETSQKTVKALLTKNDNGKSYQYIIPPYQREYSWKEEQWETLFNDIYENEPGYFLGSIICISSENNRLDVIDGQQRLTTLSILLLSLYGELKEYGECFSLGNEDNEESISKFLDLKKCFKVNNELKLVLSKQNYNNKDYNFLVDSFFSKNVDKPKNYGNRRISKAATYFSKRIKEELINLEDNVKKVEILLKLLDRINASLIVKIETEDASSAFILFESINNRGMSLTPIDLIKNNLISKLSDDKEPEETNDQWQKVINNINDYESQVRFLRHYYNVFSNLKNYNFEVKVKEISKATKSSLIKIYSEIIKTNSSLLINDLIEKSSVYTNFINPREINEESEYAKYKYSLENLNKIGVAPANALLLYLFLYHKKEDLTGILNFLEKWFIIRHITNVPSTNRLDAIFIDTIRMLEEGKNLGDVKNSLLGEMDNNDVIKEKLRNNSIYDFSPNLTKSLLVNIERNLSTKETLKDYWKLDNKRPLWTVEHIYPRNPKDEDKDGECEKLKDTLGNLTITAYNGNLSNRSFSDKLALEKDGKEIGFNSGNIKINSLLVNKSEWKAEDINERAEWLIETFLKDFY